MAIRVDMQSMTLRELGRVGELLAPTSLADAMTGPQQPIAIAALLCIVRQRDDPSFTFDDALDLPMSEVDLVGPTPEPSSADNGAAPPMSPVSGA